jgi:uncharacterized protein
MINSKISRNELRFFGSVVLMLIILILSGDAWSQSLLWKISEEPGATPSYLYGTIHLKDPRVFEWKDSVYRRIDLCKAFAGEIDLNAVNLAKAAELMMLPDGQTLRDRFSPTEYSMLQQAVKTCSGYDLSLFNNLKPMALIALCFLNSSSSGMIATVDELLYQKAVSCGKKISGLETIDEQVALMDKIPDSYVVEYFSNLGEQEAEFEKLIRCYQRADLDSIWLLVQDEESGIMLNDDLIRSRNYRMAERIVPLIQQQPTFIAIGSGHLPGEEGVIALLRKEGYTVEPVRIW